MFLSISHIYAETLLATHIYNFSSGTPNKLQACQIYYILVSIISAYSQKPPLQAYQWTQA